MGTGRRLSGCRGHHGGGEDGPLRMTPRKQRQRELLGADVLTQVGEWRCELLEFSLVALLRALLLSSPCSVWQPVPHCCGVTLITEVSLFLGLMIGNIYDNAWAKTVPYVLGHLPLLKGQDLGDDVVGNRSPVWRGCRVIREAGSRAGVGRPEITARSFPINKS